MTWNEEEEDNEVNEDDIEWSIQKSPVKSRSELADDLDGSFLHVRGQEIDGSFLHVRGQDRFYLSNIFSSTLKKKRMKTHVIL